MTGHADEGGREGTTTAQGTQRRGAGLGGLFESFENRSVLPDGKFDE